jgi:hypothetical protein
MDCIIYYKYYNNVVRQRTNATSPASCQELKQLDVLCWVLMIGCSNISQSGGLFSQL